MNNELKDFIKNNNDIVICGLEGCRKTKSIIEVIMSEINFQNDEVVIMAFKSFALMKEKQLDIIRDYGLTEKECPIVANAYKEKYDEYYTNKENPNKIPKEAKIIMMSQKGLQKCHHMIFKFEKKKYIKYIICDEFDVSLSVVPSVNYVSRHYLDSCVFGKKPNTKNFLEFLKEEYSYFDYYEVSKNGKNHKDDFSIAFWIRNNQQYLIKTIFTTSEVLGRKLLEEIGFNSFEMPSQDFSSHTIHVTAKSITSHVFDRLNDNNKWHIFGFNTIISDRCKTDLLKTNVVDLKIINHSGIVKHEQPLEVINHMSVRGSNRFLGKDVLTIISNIPVEVIQKLVDTLNYFESSGKSHEFNEIKGLLNRDKLMQAVGRVIGHRGEYAGKEETWVIIHTTILENLLENLKNNIISFPYKLENWNYENNELDEIIHSVAIDNRIKKESTNHKRTEKKAERISIINSIFSELFEIKEGSRLTFDEIRKIVSDKNSSYHSKLIPLLAANYFGLKTKRTSTTIDCEKGERFKYKYVQNLGLKSSK